MNDDPRIAGKGGTNSDSEYIMGDFFNFKNDEQRKDWYAKSYRSIMIVLAPDRAPIAIDPLACPPRVPEKRQSDSTGKQHSDAAIALAMLIYAHAEMGSVEPWDCVTENRSEVMGDGFGFEGW